jgi:hypothetical protein
LTKGPFNALWPVVDLNNALVSMIVTEYAGFTSAAGHVGPHYRFDHDVSMLVPEIWCRMRVDERDPRYLIENGYLAKLDDFEFEGRTVRSSLLGYRITARFAEKFLGRIFETPDAIFPEDLLCPELQDMAVFVGGVDAIVEAQRRVALNYFEDGSVEAACPPLKALLHIMARGAYEGHDATHPDIRALFDRDRMLASEWYKERLRVKQERDTALWSRHGISLEAFRASGIPTGSLDIDGRAALVQQQLRRVTSPAYLEELSGTIGADPFALQLKTR